MPAILGGAPPAANAKIFAMNHHCHLERSEAQSRGPHGTSLDLRRGSSTSLGMTALLASIQTRATFPARERPMAARRSAHLVPHAGLNQRMRSRRSLTKEQFAERRSPVPPRREDKTKCQEPLTPRPAGSDASAFSIKPRVTAAAVPNFSVTRKTRR